MNPDDVKALVEAGFDGADVAVEGEGDRFLIRVVSDAFEGLMPVKRQQLIYACINDRIKDNSIHAVSLKTFTRAEWDKAQKMGIA
ncbi:MAG: BolA family protein [Alcanivorax sp.]|uniref:BolA family transcriptional regulator n=1 Tax=Alloalcanivorax marinus TaxID=1177169 RepID=A0A9Q3UNI2_9GAMM|nr:BolA family protein [Alloalcanivorax marinus]MBM7332411.1 BolA family transcriptional regulator [Alloalcanivorax marinus]MCC4308203.1 BolA family transcriptional regulator [Alloalcanivorax marinus]MCU5787383.1 toluene-tolerance protein [Alloalcanivorax marinus]